MLYSNCPHHEFLSRKYPPAGQVRHFLLGAGTLTGTGPVLTVRGCQRGCAAPRHLLPLPVAVPLNQDASGPGPRRWQGHLGPVRGSSCRAGRGPGRWRWLGKRIEGTAWPLAGIRPGIRKQEQRTIRLLVPENRQDFAESFRKTPVISRRGDVTLTSVRRHGRSTKRRNERTWNKDRTARRARQQGTNEATDARHLQWQEGYR